MFNSYMRNQLRKEGEPKYRETEAGSNNNKGWLPNIDETRKPNQWTNEKNLNWKDTRKLGARKYMLWPRTEEDRDDTVGWRAKWKHMGTWQEQIRRNETGEAKLNAPNSRDSQNKTDVQTLKLWLRCVDLIQADMTKRPWQRQRKEKQSLKQTQRTRQTLTGDTGMTQRNLTDKRPETPKKTPKEWNPRLTL